MNAADELAALKAARWALDRKINEAEARVWTVIDDTGAKSFLTEIGQVILAIPNPTILFDEAALYQFADDHDADHQAIETIHQVRGSFRKLFMIDGDSVIFEPTGEVVPWAKIRNGNPWLTVRLTDDAKDHAYELLSDPHRGRLILYGSDHDMD